MRALLVLFAVLLIAFMLITAARLKKPTTDDTKEKPKARPPLTEREQAMFFRLKESLPDHVTLAQVAFSSLVTATDRSTRNSFDRKVADFVVCTKAFEVLAVIELDDATHRTKRGADAARDTLLRDAGYRVIRWANIPNRDEVVKAFTAATSVERPARSPARADAA